MKSKVPNPWIRKSPKDRLYSCPFPLIGLTGGIATGKSTAGRFFEEKGYFKIDADQLVKKVYQRPETLDFISDKFPEALENNTLDFAILRKKVFSENHTKELLENFIHPKLEAEFLKELQKAGDAKVVIYEVPLLFEKDMEKFFDLTVVTGLTSEEQLKRLQERNQLSEDEAKKIISAQMSLEEKRKRADIILDNSKDIDFLKNQVDALIKELNI